MTIALIIHARFNKYIIYLTNELNLLISKMFIKQQEVKNYDQDALYN